MKSSLAVAVVAVAWAGCTQVTRYDPTHFSPRRIAKDRQVPGRALVLTTAADDARVWRGHSRGRLAPTVEVPVGVIAREAALRVFGELFPEGAVAAHGGGADLALYRALITADIASFGFFRHLLGDSDVELSLRVTVRMPQDGVCFERTYARRAEGLAELRDLTPEGSAGAYAHPLAQAAMLDAAADLAKELARPPGTPPTSPCPASPTSPSAQPSAPTDAPAATPPAP